MKKRDLTNFIFGDLKVISFAGRRGGRGHWNCVCQCPLNTEMVVSHHALWHNIIESCGKSTRCSRKPRYGSDPGPQKRFVDLTGRQFSELTVVKHHGRYHNKHFWLCRCRCGCAVSVPSTALVSGNTRSCGCIRRTGLTMVERRERRQNASAIWAAILRKSPSRVSPEWAQSFEQFYKDVGDQPSVRHRLARVDIHQPWGAGNAVWTTVAE